MGRRRHALLFTRLGAHVRLRDMPEHLAFRSELGCALRAPKSLAHVTVYLH